MVRKASRILQPKDEIIWSNISWLVGRTLSYIDITIEGPSEDRYCKKNVLKKLFEKEIYDVRNALCGLAVEVLKQQMPLLFEKLSDKLVHLASASIDEPVCLKSFTTLIEDSIAEARGKIDFELTEEICRGRN